MFSFLLLTLRVFLSLGSSCLCFLVFFHDMWFLPSEHCGLKRCLIRFQFSFFKKIIYLNWRIIALHIVMLFVIHRHESSLGACVPPSWPALPAPSAPHRSLLSQSTGFECPASWTELALVNYFPYGNIHVSMLISQNIPPLPSPTESKSQLFTSVSLLLPCI